MSYSLSLSKGKGESKCIAKIEGGKNNGKLVYVVKNEDAPSLKKSLDVDDLQDKMIQLKVKARDRVRYLAEIEELLEDNVQIEDLPSNDKILYELYKQCFKQKQNLNSFKLGYGEKFMICPPEDPVKTLRVYIAGMTESGKSYIVKDIVNCYHALFPKRKLYVISKLKKDDTLDSANAKLVRIDPNSFLTDAPKLEEFTNKEGSVIIFDDFDSFEPKLLKIITTFINDCCQMGRHEKISTIIATHHITNYSKSAVMLSECNLYVLFPQATVKRKLQYILENYGGIEDSWVKKMKKMGRWVCVCRTVPQYIVSENEVALITSTDSDSE
ncbi:MAG: hypothetical protein P4L35_07790 [Ignavibacteriaceae bacterium]|nr:hypothetical protein [Ignavibacteriaceae bacterium]